MIASPKYFIYVALASQLCIFSNGFQVNRNAINARVSSFDRRVSSSAQIIYIRPARTYASMHIGHGHSHQNLPDDSGTGKSIAADSSNTDNTFKIIPSRANIRVIVSSLLVVIIPAIIRRKLTKLDAGIFLFVLTCLSVVDLAKATVYDWVSKIKHIRKLVVKHSTPITRKYFFKNENAADKVTLLGVFVNIALSIAKYFGGIGQSSLCRFTFWFCTP